jgi:signal transduction histidine kinase
MILIGNAIKFLPEDSHISVSAGENDNKVYVEVVDDGPGIEQEDIDKVFDRSVQVKKIISSGEHGTGLGLSIAKEIIEMHGGHIRVKSTPGAGTTFSFVLPKCLEESEREK